MVANLNTAIGFVKREGPILPAQLASELNTNILFASAILSELSSKKEVLITSVKKGGSPFYYTKGQEEKLQSLSDNLSEKLKEAYELIKKDKVLRDSTLLPWQRVAFREIKDYAIQLNVGLSSGYELFWKWYLLDNEEVKEYIKKIIGGKKKSEKIDKEEISQKSSEESIKEKIKEKILPKKKPNKIEEEDYLPKINDFFESNDIYEISQDSVRKNKEINFVVDLPSNIGKLRYFVKFKNKKVISDHDLISALDESNKKGLPLLFLSNGELNKKAEKYINDNISGKMIFKKI